MTAPHGLSADRLRIWQPVYCVVEHVGSYRSVNGHDYPLRIYAGDRGEISYFHSDGRFTITWISNPSTPVAYGTEAWPSPVAPIVGDAPPVVPDARETVWDSAFNRHFGG